MCNERMLVQVLLTDTVGFIQKLPTQLVAAFRATLEEITEASLLLHVVDVSHPNAAAQTQAVMQVSQSHQILLRKGFVTNTPWAASFVVIMWSLSHSLCPGAQSLYRLD